MSNANVLLRKALNIVDALMSLFPDPMRVPKGHRLIGRQGWVFIAESDPCMKRCNVLTLELLELAPQLERKLRSMRIEFGAEKIRSALAVEGFETQGIKPVGRGVFIDREKSISEMRILRSYFTIEDSAEALADERTAAVELNPTARIPKRRGPRPDPEKDRIEEMYLKRMKKADYYAIVEALNLRVWNGRLPLKRVECVVNALQKREGRAKRGKQNRS